MSEIILPMSPIAAETQDPRNLILFGKPKIGKTTLLSTLPQNLILDFERGAKYISGLKMEVKDIPHLVQICKAIKDAGKPYKFITIDTVTALEDFAKPLALQMYKSTPAGANFVGDDVTTAPRGAGWGIMRNAIEKLIGIVSDACENVILVGHVKDTVVGDESNSLEIKDLDLVGKICRSIE